MSNITSESGTLGQRRPPARRPAQSAPAAFSAMAAMALALSLLACCPLVSMLGGILGLVAYRRIALSGGRLRGRRVALAAALLGAALGLLGGIGWSWFFRELENSMRGSAIAAVPQFVNASAVGDTPVALRHWDAQAPLPRGAVEDFGRQVAQRRGKLIEFRITSMVKAGTFLAPTIEVAGTFVFTSGEVPGSALFSVIPPNALRMPDMRLRRLVIDDPEHGRMQLPIATPATSAPATRPR